MHFVSAYVVHPYSSINTATVWKKSRLTLSDRLGFHMIDNLSITVYAFAYINFTLSRVLDVGDGDVVDSHLRTEGGTKQ